MTAKYRDDDVACDDIYRREITTIELRRGFEIRVSARLPLSPDGVYELSKVVQRLRASLRHYRPAEKEADREGG
jgi:hypothetical protein